MFIKYVQSSSVKTWKASEFGSRREILIQLVFALLIVNSLILDSLSFVS